MEKLNLIRNQKKENENIIRRMMYLKFNLDYNEQVFLFIYKVSKRHMPRFLNIKIVDIWRN